MTLCVNVTDLSVRSIATYLQRLVVLRLGWCKEITDWGLLGMVETTICEPDQEMVRPALFCQGPVFHLELRSMQAEGLVMFLVPPGGHWIHVRHVPCVSVSFVAGVSNLTHFYELVLQHGLHGGSIHWLPFVTSQRTFPMYVS